MKLVVRALDLAPWQSSEHKEIFEDDLVGSFVSSIPVPAGLSDSEGLISIWTNMDNNGAAGSQRGKVVFDNDNIIPGRSAIDFSHMNLLILVVGPFRYFYVYRLNSEFSNDDRGLLIARSPLCLLRVSLPVEKVVCCD